jgi:crotonobetainyl-CoA:carnitine CoA-transferase CaiB-like acyl-CoA transferase
MRTDPQAGPPLAGVTVLDFSELLPGPFLTQCLADMGAHVIKIERPGGGDAARKLSPGVFASVNRGKSSVVADLKSEQGRADVLALLAEADVLVESYRPGVLSRLGLGYDALAPTHPTLVYASLTGYGQNGPDAMLPGHDINYLAAAGALSLMMTDAGEESARGLPIADLAGAMAGLSAVLAALWQCGRTGRGQYLDVSLTQSVLHWMNPRLGHFVHIGATDARTQRRIAAQRPAYGIFRCADGEAITLAALEDPFWQRLMRVVPLASYDDARFGAYAARAPQAAAINAALASAFCTMDSVSLLARLYEADVPAMRLVEPSDLAQADHVRARDAMAQTDAGPLANFPVRLEGMAATPATVSELGKRHG